MGDSGQWKIDSGQQGFHFRFHDGGGMVPPLRGGTQGGVIGQQGGGMARDPDATMKHLMPLCK